MPADAAVEATAGAIGALLTAVMLSPVDTAKLRMQTGDSKEGTVGTMRTIVRKDSVAALFKGLGPKCFHVVLQNYTYFYIYEWLKHQRQTRLKMQASTLANIVSGVVLPPGLRSRMKPCEAV